jgi:hypothetical protein
VRLRKQIKTWLLQLLLNPVRSVRTKCPLNLVISSDNFLSEAKTTHFRTQMVNGKPQIYFDEIVGLLACVFHVSLILKTSSRGATSATANESETQ